MYQRIVILKPCCIGDIVFATPLLMALRRAYPDATIDWAVNAGCIGVLRDHPAIGQLIDTGRLANPASRPKPMLRLKWALIRGKYDLAVVPDRSRLLAMLPLLSYIPHRAGLDSAGRGFAYTIKATIDPNEARHEADIYLDIGRALGIDVSGLYAHTPPSEPALNAAQRIMTQEGLEAGCFLLAHPGGGINPGMTMTLKRYPPERMAALAAQITAAYNLRLVLIGTTTDREAVDAVQAALPRPALDLCQRLDLPTTAALATRAALYLGNDNGVGHLAAGAGAKVLMIFGPSDPKRYAPFVPASQARAAWRPVDLPAGGVADGAPSEFDWARDGISVEDAFAEARALLGS